jgi:hypothetical protein
VEILNVDVLQKGFRLVKVHHWLQQDRCSSEGHNPGKELSLVTHLEQLLEE